MNILTIEYIQQKLQSEHGNSDWLIDTLEKGITAQPDKI